MIFILGCQRSGTTLLQMMLANHPLIVMHGEGETLRYFEQNSVATPDPAGYHLAFKYPNLTDIFAQFHPAFWGPHHRYIYIWRDLRSVVYSMMHLPWPNKESPRSSWAQQWAWQDALQTLGKAWITNGTQWNMDQDKVDLIISMIFNGSLAEQTTVCAYLRTHLYGFMENRHFNLFPIEYSALVTHPRKEMIATLEFLSLPWDELVLEHHLNPNNKGRRYPGLAEADKPVHQNSLVKWKDWEYTTEVVDTAHWLEDITGVTTNWYNPD